MSWTGTGDGRRDQLGPRWMLPRTAAKLQLGAAAVVLVACWQAAISLTANVALIDLRTGLSGLLPGDPLGVRSGANLPMTLTLFAVFTLTCGGVGGWLALNLAGRRARGWGGKGLASPCTIKDVLGEHTARVGARQTRPGLGPSERKHAPIADLALPLGHTETGVALYASLQEHVQVAAPTGAGKTGSVMIPAVLNAPGPLIVTSTRADVLDATVTSIAGRGSTIWVFDPLQVAGWPYPMVWNPVAGCQDAAVATGRGLAFTAALNAGQQDSTNAGFFRANAATAIACLLHAAALASRDFTSIITWGLNLSTAWEEPFDLIRRSTNPAAEPLWADQLRSLSTGARETVAATRQTLAQALTPLASQEVLKWVIPRPGAAMFDAETFAAGTDALYMLCDDNRSQNVSPLCTMLLQEVMDTAKRVALASASTRLDPPMRLIGDEIVNVAPLPRMPALASDSRGWGLQLVLAWQADDQVEQRWGRNGAATLMANMAIQLILPGITHVPTLERLSKLSGQVQVATAQHSLDGRRGRHTSTSMGTRYEPVLRADEIRRLGETDPTRALLLHRRIRAVPLQLTPWWESAAGRQLQANADCVREARHHHRQPTPH